MSKRKPKYIIPKGATFGSLPKKVEHLPEAEQQQKDYTAIRWEKLSRDLGLNGFHFEWGFYPVVYNSLEPEAIDALWAEWNKGLLAQGNRIASRNARVSFEAEAKQRRKELELTVSPALRSELLDRVVTLEHLAKVAEVMPVATPSPDDTYEDWFPTATPVTEVNMNELSQDVLELCQRYMSVIWQMQGKLTSKYDMATLDIERADLHNQLIASLAEIGIGYSERGDYIDLAEKVVKWYGVF